MSDKPVIPVPGMVVNKPTQYFIDAVAGRTALIIERHRSNPGKSITELKAEMHTLKEE